MIIENAEKKEEKGKKGVCLRGIMMRSIMILSTRRCYAVNEKRKLLSMNIGKDFASTCLGS
jgi:hypothetical protein